MAAAFVSLTSGDDSFSVTVPAGSDRLLIAIVYGSNTSTGRSATYGGTPMDVANNANEWCQMFYMLDPPEGAATLAITGGTGAGTISQTVAAHYTGVGSFQEGSQASAASASFDPDGAGLIVFGLSSESASHAPVADTNERLDDPNDWLGDRVVASAGTVTVGASVATNPDHAAAIFLEPETSANISGTVELAAVTTAGAVADGSADISGAVTLASVETSGSVTPVGGPLDITGDVVLGAVETSGRVAFGLVTDTGDEDIPLQSGARRFVGAVEVSAFTNKTTLKPNAVDNDALAQMPANTIKGNWTAADADATDNAVAADSLPARVGGNLVSHPWSTVAGLNLTYVGGAINWDGFAVADNGISAGTFRAVNFDDSAQLLVTLTDLGSSILDVSYSLAAGAISWANVLADGNNSGAFNPHIDAGQYIGYGDEGTIAGFGAGDIRFSSGFSLFGAGGISLVGTGDSVVRATAGFIRISAEGGGDLFLDCTSGSVFLNVTGAGECVHINGAQRFLKINEEASSTPTVAAGEGMFWVRADAPTVPMFTDDTDVDRRIALHDSPKLGGKASLTTLLDETNSTTVMAVSYTTAANELAVGQVWKARLELNFIHTAAATPVLRCTLAIAGATEITKDVTPIANAGTYSGYLEAVFTVVSSNTLRCSLHLHLADDVQAEVFGGSLVATANAGIADMTAAQAIALQINMVTAVASNTLAVTQGWVERVF